MSARTAPRDHGTLVLVDADMLAGFRRATPSLAQLHQAIVHLHRQHPQVVAAVLADPSLKWDLAKGEQATFEGDIVAGAVVCAPAGARDGTVGFLARAAARAASLGFTVVAVTDRALPGVALGRVRNDGGRWLWELDGAEVLATPATSQPTRRRRSRARS